MSDEDLKTQLALLHEHLKGMERVQDEIKGSITVFCEALHGTQESPGLFTRVALQQSDIKSVREDVDAAHEKHRSRDKMTITTLVSALLALAGAVFNYFLGGSHG